MKGSLTNSLQKIPLKGSEFSLRLHLNGCKVISQRWLQTKYHLHVMYHAATEKQSHRASCKEAVSCHGYTVQYVQRVAPCMTHCPTGAAEGLQRPGRSAFLADSPFFHFFQHICANLNN
jgi:hypothetical protein